ncbi:16S rRNA (cytosine(1402)-N(4))-methyltransferase RsmH [Neofamilia massiliensis]|uniref:16S rRNA (cytosine(1402)-N(4))-methyltransferase RsmH n=1 Tax=Neofamilia massiliensis TaxID=1673724 RepID=UPI0006BB75FA|nr:16S rRNA (cytosine(1402)-N(4))-methyltransferase RsmH [Neofamilia massiliensis]
MEFNHIPVLLNETIENLNIKEDGIYVDGTMGGASHSREIAKRLTRGRLIAIDQDIDAIKKGTEVLKDFEDKVTIVKSNFSNLDQVLDDLGIEKIDGLLLDLGVSSYQLDQGERGFSYHQDFPLDMRMDQSQDLSARDVVNEYSKKDLERIILTYGEERWAKRIAEFIVAERKVKPIESTFDLLEVIKKAIPKAQRMDKHPGMKTFQAIRIEVNNELNIIDKTIDMGIKRMNPKGRMCIITFHSLEDRIVKNAFRYQELDCICDPRAPICTCDKVSTIKVLSRKPILPTKEEIERNPRSRSAKLRVAMKK